MKKLIILFFSFTSSVSSTLLFSTDNIAQHSEQASYTIPFYVSRGADGALKSDLLKLLQTIFSLDVFVESGTYLGGTVINAAALFKNVYSIELSPFFAAKAKLKFKKQKHVAILHGDSGSVLRSLLPTISSRVLFYLDGHYSGGATAKGSLNTPIMEELAVIRDCQISEGVILIDDIRGFQNSYYPEKITNTCIEGYPDLSLISEALLQINPKYQICFLGVALLAFPDAPQVSVSPVAAACALHHYADVHIKISDDLLEDADRTIMEAQGFEKEQLIQYFNLYSDFELEFGFRCYGALWYGLLLYGEANVQEAHKIFKKTSECSIPGWRIDALLKRL